MVFDLAYIGYFHASHTQIYNDTGNLTIGPTANLAGYPLVSNNVLKYQCT